MPGNGETDIAAFFRTPRRIAYPAVLLGAVWFVGGSVATMFLAPPVVGKWAMLGPLFVWLGLICALLPFPAGRGALWTFGKGYSPAAQLVFCLFWIVVFSLFVGLVLP